jgi:hypothetical protein
MLNNKFEFSERRLKNLEIFGEVGGSEKWKRIALPELLLLRKSTFGGLLAAFRGADRFACYQNRQTNLIVPRSRGAARAAAPDGFTPWS